MSKTPAAGSPPRHKRKRPEFLAVKLRRVRQALGESQDGILRRLGLAGEFERDYVSKWERGFMEPPLHVLCAYADAANIYPEVLARDTLALPESLPARQKSMGVKIKK